VKEILREAKFLISFATFTCFDPSDPADKIARVLEEKSGVYPVDIIPPWFSMLIYITW
jgi:quinol-cytochrome oxidoreductase complex cytochrome b subunit